MPYIVHEIPYLDTRDLNLDWLLKKIRELDQRQDELEQEIIQHGALCLIKVEDYGAKGDGITDDTEAIQKCIDENPCATIFFRKGIYKITDTIHCYMEVGGQQLVLGGSTLVWGGAYNDTKAMISVTKALPDDGTGNDYSSPCRILGGNLNGQKRVGYGIEMYSYYGIVDSTKIKGFNKAGLFVGALDGSPTKSMQGKFNNLMIYQTEGNYSAEDTAAVVCVCPDNEYSQVVTNRTKVGFELRSGGNSFVNCHVTIQFYAPDSATMAEYMQTKNIYLNPDGSGITQPNNFSNCYFNMGAYLLYSEIMSRCCTNLDSCYYVWYTANHDHYFNLWRNQVDPSDPEYPIPDVPNSSYEVGLYIPVYICGGRGSDFRCNNLDVLVGDKGCVMDYFPQSQPTIVPLPDMIRINSNDRHPEAPVWSAWNWQPENTLTPLCSTSNPVTLNTYYEVGAIMLCYGGTATTSPFTTPVKVRAYEGAGVAEWTIGFESDGLTPPRLHPVIQDWHCTTNFNTLLFFIEPDPEDIEIEGIVYPCYKIYMQKTAYASYPVFCTIENDSPFIKAYIRAQANNSRVRADGTGLLQLYNRVSIPEGNDVTFHANLTPGSLNVRHICPGLFSIGLSAQATASIPINSAIVTFNNFTASPGSPIVIALPGSQNIGGNIASGDNKIINQQVIPSGAFIIIKCMITTL